MLIAHLKAIQFCLLGTILLFHIKLVQYTFILMVRLLAQRQDWLQRLAAHPLSAQLETLETNLLLWQSRSGILFFQTKRGAHHSTWVTTFIICLHHKTQHFSNTFLLHLNLVTKTTIMSMFQTLILIQEQVFSTKPLQNLFVTALELIQTICW